MPFTMMPIEPTTIASAREKEIALISWLRERKRVAIGFSGGVDSAYLACVAVDALGSANVLAIIGKSASYPAAQWAAARGVADRFAVPVLEIDTHEMEDPRYAANPANRCYFCKTELWSLVVPAARQRGIDTVVDGTNADDMTGHRPGAVAAKENAVESPLLIVGLTKAEIRALSQERGIPTWAQPSSPCLSSRIPYGIAVTATRLAMIERAEAALRALGISGDLRVRYHDELARVELGSAELEGWLEPEASEQLAAAVRDAGFERVAIDLRGFRSGSLNVLTGVSAA
jgi:pyridinium-3,5-biscarboxylic acid mononucleotide sulfurtransferase